MPCPPTRLYPRLFPFHSYPFHGNVSIFPHLSFSLVFFPFSSLFFQHVTSNSIESITFHGNQMPCPPTQIHPRLFPFHSYPFHGNFSIFPHLPFSLVFFPFSSLFFQHVTSNSIESITFHGNLFVHSFNQSSPSSSSFFSF